MITGASRVRLCPDVRYRIIDGEAVVVRQEVGEVVVLSPVGARILDLVREVDGVSNLLDCLIREYDADAESLERDLHGFLQELLDAGVIDIMGESSSTDVP